MKPEQRVSSPLWLEHSGLPAQINEAVKGGCGWSVFKKIVELDCAANPEPDTVEITIEDLATRCGVAPAAIRKSAQALRKLKLVSCFLPDSDEEAALFQIRVPLKTPVPLKELKASLPLIFADANQYCRYLRAAQATAETGDETSDTVLQEIVDLYFNTVGLRMNAFVLDELRLIRTRFPLDKVRRAFRKAQQNEIHSLHWIVRDLVRSRGKKQGEDETQADEN